MAYIRAKDRIGTTVNGFYVEDVKREGKQTYTYVVCPYCKSKKWIRMDTIVSGSIISCGCYNAENNYRKSVNIKNKFFGYLEALEPTEKRDKNNGSIIWKCECKCGNICYVSAANLKRGAVASCGCLATKIHSNTGKIAGKNIANPIATILSAVMMLRYTFDLDKEADAVERAVKLVLKKGYRTGDIMSEGKTQVGTKEMGDKIVEEIKNQK